MRVLVVDDEPLARAALTELLSQRSDVEKFDVAEDAHQALATLRAHPYDVLLLDIHMPDLSGLQLIERPSKQDGPMPSVVFITAYHEHAVEAFVDTIQPGAGSEYLLRTKTGRQYHVTRTYRKNLRGLAQFWIGTEGFDSD